MAEPVLLACEGVSKSFGGLPLFDGLNLVLHEGDHVGLVGPNGAGKSTLLRILAGVEAPDEGSRTSRRGLRVGYVPQHPAFEPGHSVEQVLVDALAGAGALPEHEQAQRAGVALSRSGFGDPRQPAGELSGGWRTRLAIARALALEPDVLLLDEPTNHLDVEAILWLEALLAQVPGALVVVSHDRYFLDNVARRMLELSPVHAGGLLDAKGSYADFLETRDELLRNQLEYRETLANLVRREVEWLRRGPKARTGKSRARIQAAEASIEELDTVRRRTADASVGLDFNASGRRTRRLWFGRGLSKSFADKRVFAGVDVALTRGTRLGIIGPNGSGKTTLLRTIVGEIEPDGGTVERADGLRTVYLDQNRGSLDPSLTLRRALAPAGDSVVYGGRELHVASWARRFLFRADQLDTVVSRLSGGERARIVLARTMLRPADLLVLDEPTNDLDIPTLDVLEEALLEFPGAMVLVTHDRYLLDRVSNRLLALDGRGGARPYADLAQWEADRPRPESPKPKARGPRPRTTESPKPRKLSYLEQREWDAMEGRVLEAEERLEQARLAAEDPAIASDAAALEQRHTALAERRAEVDRLYARWAELEEKLT